MHDPELLWLQNRYGRPLTAAAPLPRLPDPTLVDPVGCWRFLSYGRERPTAEALTAAGLTRDWPRLDDPTPEELERLRKIWRVRADIADRERRREALRARVRASG